MAESWKSMFVIAPGKKLPPEDAPQENLCDNSLNSMEMSDVTLPDDIAPPIPTIPQPDGLCSEPSESFLGLSTPAVAEAPSNLFEGCFNYDDPHNRVSSDSVESMWTDPFLSPFNESGKTPESVAVSPKIKTAETSRRGPILPGSRSKNHSSSSASSSSRPSSRVNKTKTSNERERNRVAAAKCRKKAKLSQCELQERERALAQQNRFLLASIGELKEEVLYLRHEILKHNACNSELINEYIQKAAQGLSTQMELARIVLGLSLVSLETDDLPNGTPN
ncbi:hypothetical protein K449DRAFT_430737 [Hypoxylon sp. EC38]|nr:hypothetical protein K449DRAFT_430737 [Hypoxylon sp. EC38]